MSKKGGHKKNSQVAKVNTDLIATVYNADELIQKINIEKSLVLEKALKSGNVETIFKAQNYLTQISSIGKNKIEQSRTMFIDPLTLNSGLGYQEKPLNISLQVLRNMGKVPVIKSVIGTRIDQVCNFAQPQQDKYSTGFIVRPKKLASTGDGEVELTKQQQIEIENITEFILNCGVDAVDPYRHDSFETFLKKLVKDCLEMDQGTFDLVNTRGGDLFAFQATDGATFRIADTYFKQIDEEYKYKHSDEYVNGYLPYYVQVYMNRIINEYYPWEMAFCIRNPDTNIYSNGYGRSELEDLIHTVTNLLNADSYNANYFKVGSNPKGIIRVTGNVNQTRLEEFKVQWQRQMAGVQNAHKLPVIEAEKMDFISTQTSNKDMEYSKYYEFLIKIACAVYRIDPAEINFPLSGGSDQKAMFEGSNEARIKHSRDKGLKPLLRFIQSKINKHIISRIAPDYEFLFVGLELEDQKEELEDNVKKIQNFMTVNEIRRKYKLKDIPDEEGGNLILNPILSQLKMQKDMMEQQGNENANQYIDDEYGKEDEENNPFTKSKETNPILDAAMKDINKILVA